MFFDVRNSNKMTNKFHSSICILNFVVFLKKDLFNVRILGVFLIVPVLYIESAKLTVYYKAIQYKKKSNF